MRLVLPAGKTMPQHWVEGEVTIQCLEGSIELDAQQNGRELKQVLHAGELVYLAGGVPHSLRALENASVLMTILLHRPDSTGGPAR
jgi:quercetin dioxygenase-like cupin family protein